MKLKMKRLILTAGVLFALAGAGQGASMTDCSAAPYNADKTGTTGAFTAIRACLAGAIAAGTNRVYLPTGTYLYSQAEYDSLSPAGIGLNITTAGVEVFGDGMGKTIVRLPDSLVKSAVSNPNSIFRAAVADCYFHDFTIIGATTVTFAPANIVAIVGGLRGKVERVEVTNFNNSNTSDAGAFAIGFGSGGVTQIINTTMGADISAGQLVTITPTSNVNIYKGMTLRIGGANPEDVAVVGQSETTFTATLLYNHLSTDTITGYDDGYLGGRIIDCYIHDSRHASGIDLTSTGNVVSGTRIINIGDNGLQHGIYISGGNNRIINNELRGIAGFGFHQYPAGNGILESSGNIYSNNLLIGASVTVYEDTSNGTNPRVPAGDSLVRYTTFTSNVFINCLLNSYKPLILSGNIFQGSNAGVSYPLGSQVSPDNLLNGEIISGPLTSSAGNKSPGPGIHSGTVRTNTVAHTFVIQAQSGFGGAETNNHGPAFGGSLHLKAGAGRRRFDVISNTAGAVSVTLTFYPIENVNAAVPGTFTATYTSGVDFVLGSDNSPTQLALTAYNLGRAIDINTTAQSFGSAVYVYSSPVSVSTNNTSAITATNGQDGFVAISGALSLPVATVTNIGSAGTLTNYSYYQRWASGGAQDVNGINFTYPFLNPSSGAVIADGVTLMIINVGSFNITLKHEVAAAPNTIHNTTGADIVLAPDQQALCWHDGTTEKWRCSKMN